MIGLYEFLVLEAFIMVYMYISFLFVLFAFYALDKKYSDSLYGEKLDYTFAEIKVTLVIFMVAACSVIYSNIEPDFTALMGFKVLFHSLFVVRICAGMHIVKNQLVHGTVFKNGLKLIIREVGCILPILALFYLLFI